MQLLLEANSCRKNEFSTPYIQYLYAQVTVMKSYKRSILWLAVLFLLATVPAIQGDSSGKHNQAPDNTGPANVPTTGCCCGTCRPATMDR